MTCISDVMTAPVVTVNRLTPDKEIARLLTRHQISGLPVVHTDQRVVGVISEADLVAVRDKTAWRARAGAAARRQWHGLQGHAVILAGELMTAPAVTIHPDETVLTAARVMTAYGISRLPVVSKDGTLIGIVSQGDLLRALAGPQ
jgi:CBS domain-containing protein